MQRLDRLFAIHDTLRRSAPHRVSARRLAEEFDVSRRTIERDLASLRAAGVPLYAEYGRTGGQISLDRGGNVVVTLSPSEVTALLAAVAAAGPDMPYREAATTAVNRLLDTLPAATRVGVEELRSRIRTRVSPADRASIRVRRSVEAAVQRGVVLNLVHENAAGVTTRRSVDAVGLYQGAGGWYLIAWCHLREDGRLFRLDRIRSARLTRRPIPTRDVDETLGWTPDELREL